MNPRPISDVSQFVEMVEQFNVRDRVAMVYRGHSGVGHILTPSIFRNEGHSKNEAEMMQRVFASQPDAFQSDHSMLEKLVRFQHYSLPTRLLDVTWNPLVALYFCVYKSLETDGEVVVIGCSKKREKYFDSDTVSCLANLAHLTMLERSTLRNNYGETVVGFNRLNETKRLVNFIQAEKPYFKNAIKPADLAYPILVRPKLTNRRIAAQNGAFIIHGLEPNLSYGSDNPEFKTGTLIVRSENKRLILKQLDRLGINDGSMFPELESAAKYVSKQFRE